MAIIKTDVLDKSYFWVQWSQNSQSIENNSTTINWSCGFNPGRQYYLNAIKMNAVTINGVEVYSGGTYSNITDYQDRTFASGTLKIAHTSDGSKSFTISGFSGWIYESGTTYASSQTFTLPTIPRASSVSCSAANIGSNATISISRASSDFTHTLTYSFGSLSDTIATKTSSTSISWTLPTTFYAQIPNSKNGTGTITCQTYNGSTLIGTKTCSFVATANEAISKPTLSPVVADSNTATTALTGDSAKFIKYYSKASVATGAKARNSATLKSQKIVCGAKSLTTASGTISAVESGFFTFSATDSRGYTTTQTVNKTLIEYVKLTCSMEAGAPTTAGVATLKISGNYFNGSFGKVANTLTVQYRYKTQGGSYGSWTMVTATKSGNTYSATASISGLNYLNTYVFQVRAIDKLATVDSNEQTRKTTPVFDWSKDDFNINGTLKVRDKVSFEGNLTGKYLTGTWLQTTATMDLGKAPPKIAVLDNAGWIYYRTLAELRADLGLEDFVIEQGTSGIWTYRKWNSGLAEYWGKEQGFTLNDGWHRSPAAPFTIVNENYSVVTVTNWYGNDDNRAARPNIITCGGVYADGSISVYNRNYDGTQGTGYRAYYYDVKAYWK